MMATLNSLFNTQLGRQQAAPQQPVLPFDPWVLGCATALILIGFVMISSASLDVALENNGTPYFYVIRQAVFIAIAVVGAAIVWRIPLSFWESTGHWWMLGAGLLLLLVLIPGIGKNGKMVVDVGYP